MKIPLEIMEFFFIYLYNFSCMINKEKLRKISNETARSSVGIFICLFAIYLSLNLAPVSQYDFFIYLARAITWVVAFFVGGIFSYIIYLLLFIYGLSLIIYHKKTKLRLALFISGVILFSLGGMILLTNGFNLRTLESGEIGYLTFDNFGTVLLNNVIYTDSVFRINIIYNSGIIGMFLTALINQFLGYVGSYTIGSIVFVAGTILLLIRPSMYLIKKFNEYRNFNYQYSPKSAFTKAKDITLTTTTIDSLEDGDDTNIEVKQEHETNKEVKESKYTPNDYIEKVEKERNDFVRPAFIDPSQPEEQYYAGDHFEDKPLTRAHFSEDDFSDKVIFNNKNTENNNFKANSYKEVQSRPLTQEVEKYHYDTPKSDVAIKPTFGYLDDLNKENSVSQTKPKIRKKQKYIAPSLSLLENRTTHETDQKNKEVAEERSDTINQVLTDLGVKARVVSYKIGPSVTRYDIQTERSESIKGFDSYINDICIRLGGVNARFSPIVLGKTTSGLEIANAVCSIVNFKDCLQALNRLPKTKPTNIPFGKDINNELLSVDLQETPHLLVSGTTGSGKSIFVHSLIMTLIMRNSPDSLKLLLIDPKTVEFNKYREIPHLLCPPVGIDDPQRPYEILTKICDIMEERYALFAETDCSKLKEYNEWALAHGKETLPVIVVVVDEYADLVESNKRISEPVVRIGQKARAAGIHMIIATQRPSVNVINGVIKANIPSRVALLSSSYTDSNTIVDQGGAEKLIGNGDMLIKCALLSNTFLIRCQGAYVSNQEIKAVCDYLRNNYETQYDEEIMDMINKPVAQDPALMEASKESRFGSDEDIYQEVKNWAMSEEYISMSKIQTTFSIGFNRASRIFKRLQREGVVSSDPATNSSKGSKVLLHNFDYNAVKEEYSGGSIEQTTFKKK